LFPLNAQNSTQVECLLALSTLRTIATSLLKDARKQSRVPLINEGYAKPTEVVGTEKRAASPPLSLLGEHAEKSRKQRDEGR
jgi:hypothetical protein